jgi:isorenieratene synthase
MKTLSFCLLSCLLIGTFAKPPVVIEPKNPNDPPQLPKGSIKKVLVIGGGLAGLSAALELADRGYLVTIKEKSQTGVGGKLFCHPVQVFPDKQFYVEHGFHAWFHNYYQFKDIRNRLNINSNFRNWAKVNFIFKEYKPEVIYSQGPYPLNLLGIIERSPNLKLTDALLSTLSLPDLIFFDYDHMFEKYDNITFHQWAQEKKVSKPFYDIIMQPALSVTLNERDIFSAAEMLTFMQIYFLTNSESDNREVPTVNYYQAVLKPWTDYLEKHNVK